MSADRTEAFPPPVPPGAPAAEGAPASPPQPTEAATLLGSASSPRASGEFLLLSGPNEQPLGGVWPTVQGYEILAEIGRGGMGVVYKARQAGLKRLVALKMILSGGHASALELTRFCSEAEAIARLEHPNIVHIHEVGESEGRPYFSLEFVDGGSLADRLDGTPWPPAQAARLIETLAHAMQTAHEQNIIHRDLKPANILLQKKSEFKRHKADERTDRINISESALLTLDFSPKITDFGLAKQMDSEHGQTRSGAIMGTPSYMAPEQAGGKGKEVGPATDVYALGAVLYELLTGRPPFKAATPLDTVLQVVGEDPVPPRRLQPKLPRDLDTICLKCLEKNPAKRYPSAAELADDLARWRQMQPIRARRISRVGRGIRWCRRNPVLASVTALATAVILVLSVVFYVSLLRENDRTRAALRQTKIEEDQSQDILVRSLFEQARAVRLSNQPGRRWQALELLAQAETLRDRKRLVDLPPEELDYPLLTEAELRREAAAVLLLEDARVVRQVPLAAASLFAPQVTCDGRHAAAWWMRPRELEFGIRLLDLTTDKGSVLNEASLSSQANSSWAISPDEKWVVWLDRMTGAHLLELPKGEEKSSPRVLPKPKEPDDAPPPSEPISHAAFFSPNGRYFVGIRSAAKQADLFLWDLQDPSLSRHLARVDTPLACVSFRGDSRVLAYPTGDRTIALADLDTGDPPAVLTLPLRIAVAPGESRGFSRPVTLAWNPGNDLLAVACIGATGTGTVLLWDVNGQVQKARWEMDTQASTLLLAFDRAGKRLAAGSRDGSVRCYHVEDQREILHLAEAHYDQIGALVWNAQGQLLSAGKLNTFKVWELSDANLRSSVLASREGVSLFKFSPDGRWLAMRLEEPKPHIALLERATGRVRWEWSLPDDPTDQYLLFRPDGKQLAWATSAEGVLAWDLADGKELFRKEPLPAKNKWFFPVFLDEGRILTATDKRGRLLIHDLISGQEVGPGIAEALKDLLGNPGIGRTELSADGRFLFGLPDEGYPARQAIPIWDVATGEKRGELKPPDGDAPGITRFSLSRDGNRILQSTQPASYDAGVGPSEPRLSVWDVPRRQRLWQTRRTVLAKCSSFSPDGKLLAIGYQNGFVELWDVDHGEELFRWQPQGNREVAHVSFTPDGAFLASTDGAAPIQLLHVAELRRQLAAMGLDW